MKHPLFYALVIVLFLFAVSPFAVMAQSYSGITTATSSRFWHDGSSLPDSVRTQQIQEYRQQSSDLQQKINALGSTASASIFMPVLFGIGIKDISQNFGEMRSTGRPHAGEDIIAVKGTPIVSPTAAVVIRVTTNLASSEGNAVYTANPGSETFVYYHLDRIGEGVIAGRVLSQGSLIGYVGDTGSAAGTPHLHLEIHNSAGVPTDPFSRLTSEFSLQEKISYLSAILTQASDSVALARFLVTNFRGTFVLALASNIVLPQPIIDALASIPATTIPTSSVGAVLPAGDLDIGSSGAAVVALQKYLIQSASGAASLRLQSAGATGYFGPITKAALAEFQLSSGISSTGYFGPTTRAFILVHPIASSHTPIPSNPVASGSTATLTRDLYQGISGEDVRALQKLLNTNGYTVASTGLGSPGNETNYFGPATEAAVIKFQVARGITPSVGYVGQITRASLASL